jgi:DNA-binding response OmpR family regulator
VLIVEDDEALQMDYARALRDTCYRVVAARNLRDARRALRNTRPAAIVLDILLRGEDSWRWLGELKSAAPTRAIPVIVASVANDAGKGLSLGASACLDKPVGAPELIARLNEFTGRRVLVIDDDASMRYTIKRILERHYVVVEAGTGRDGLLAAATMTPSLVVLDLGLPDIDGEQVLARLRGDPLTARLPVLVATSRTLSDAEREALPAHDVMSKHDLTDRLLSLAASAVQREWRRL